MARTDEPETLDIVSAWVADAERRTGCLTRHELALLAVGRDALAAANRAATTAPRRNDSPVVYLARRYTVTLGRLRKVLAAAKTRRRPPMSRAA